MTMGAKHFGQRKQVGWVGEEVAAEARAKARLLRSDYRAVQIGEKLHSSKREKAKQKNKSARLCKRHLVTTSNRGQTSALTCIAIPLSRLPTQL